MSTVMVSTVRDIARGWPDRANGTGILFWPTPAFFPQVIATAIEALQRDITRLYVSDGSELANALALIRSKLVQLAGPGGDLAEDHCGIFLREHPQIRDDPMFLNWQQLPYGYFCNEALRIREPLELVGFIVQNELGSPAEISALREANIIADGEFFRLHVGNEPVHGSVAQELIDTIEQHPEIVRSIEKGRRLHDRLYAQAGRISSATPMV